MHDPTAEIIIPSPGFVIKGYSEKQKVFINVCYSPLVRSPHTDTDKNIRIPMSLGPVFPDVDRNDIACKVIDVIVNDETAKRSVSDAEFKKGFTQLILQGLKLKYKIALQDLRPLRLGYKGESVRPQRVRVDRSHLITDLGELGYRSVQQVPAIVPKFTFDLINGNGESVDVLSFPQYKPTAAILEENLVSEFRGKPCQKTMDLSRYTHAVIKLNNIANPKLVSLSLSAERLVVDSRTLRMNGSANVC